MIFLSALIAVSPDEKVCTMNPASARLIFRISKMSASSSTTKMFFFADFIWPLPSSAHARMRPRVPGYSPSDPSWAPCRTSTPSM